MYPAIVSQLRLILDKGVLRCRDRLENAMIPIEMKFHILLPRQCWFTNLVILAAHLVILNGRVRETLAAVSEKCWLPQGRKIVKHFIGKCVPCLKIDGKPYDGDIAPSVRPTRIREGLHSS